MIALLSLANAAPDAAAVQKHLSQQMGKDVPEKFVCTQTLEASPPLTADLTVVGVKLKHLGCVRKAVAVGDSWTPSAETMGVVSPWSSLDAESREQAAVAVVRGLTTFHSHWVSEPEAATRGSGVVVTGTFLRRTRTPMVSETVEGTWRFSSSGTLDEQETSVEKIERKLVLAPNKVKGLETEQVTTSLESIGKLFERCFAAAWRRDPGIDQRTRMTWTVSNAKATDVAVRQQSSPALSQCYANALSQAEFPADGTVDLDFGILRQAP